MQRSSFSRRAGARSANTYSRSGTYRARPTAYRSNQGQYIHPDKFVNKAVPNAEQAEFKPVHSFSDFGLLPQLLERLLARGYSAPTPVQDGAIKPAMAGQDVIGLANTGTGKTAAFLLPIIHRLKTESSVGRVLILAPTRELAVQIDEELRSLAIGLGVYSALCVGGVNIRSQISALKRGPQLVIGTPGRLKDLINQHVLHLDRVGILVLDEVDRMLDMGFLPDVRFILNQVPAQRQTLCFSATMPPAIDQMMKQMLKNPVTVSVRQGNTSQQVNQDVVRTTSKEHKLEVLLDLLNKPDFDKVLVFGKTKWGVQRLAETLSNRGYSARAIHGNKSQSQRQRALQEFKSGQVQILVATDVAARGLDIPQVSHVINFDQPASYEDYIHRIGRTGRAGQSGQALTFIGS